MRSDTNYHRDEEATVVRVEGDVEKDGRGSHEVTATFLRAFFAGAGFAGPGFGGDFREPAAVAASCCRRLVTSAFVRPYARRTSASVAAYLM